MSGSFLVQGSHNATNTVGFATVGAGSHYLTDASPYRSAGTTNIAPSLLAELKHRSTHRPVVLDGPVSLDTVLTPVVPRNVGTPDLGFAYAAADFAINTVTVQGAEVSLADGVVLAVFGDNGFWLRGDSALRSVGSPTRPNRIVRYYAVQEQPIAWENDNVSSVNNINVYETNAPPEVQLVFTHSAIPAN